MPTIERVNIDDVFPWEDEYGNEFLSRDYSTKENQRYVERLAESMRPKGVPDELVSLSRDGGIFRIVAGNSRVRAMRLLGTKEFEAIVLDDEEAEEAMRAAVETTVRTNTKKKYNPLEESRFVQQLAMFRDDDYVAQAAGIDVEQVRKVRRARKAVGDDGDELTLPKLAAIAEFEGDPNAIEQISKCKDRELDWIVRDLRHKAEQAEERAKIAAAIEQAGLTVLREVPAGAIWCASVVDPEGVPDTGGPSDPTFAVAQPIGSGFTLYRMPNANDTEQDAREAAERQELEERKLLDRAHAEAGRERRKAWLVDRLTNFDPARIPNLCELAEANLIDEYHNADDAKKALAEAGARATVGTLDVLAAAMQTEVREYGIADYWPSKRNVNRQTAWQFCDLMDAMVADGYEPDEDERAMYEEAEEAARRA